MLLVSALGLMTQGLIAMEMDGPVVHWRFDHPHSYGDMEVDASGHNNDGIVRWDKIRSVGGLQWSPNAGMHGGAGHGGAGCLQSHQPITLPQEWSLSLWVAFDKDVSGMHLVSMQQAGKKKPSTVFTLGYGKKKQLVAEINIGDKITSAVFPAGIKPIKGEWTHLAVVVGEQGVDCYINGHKQSSSTTIDWDSQQQLLLNVSAQLGQRQHRFKGGRFDELRLFARPLRDEEVFRLADKDFYATEAVRPVADAGLGYTAFLDAGKATIKMQGREMQSGQNAGATRYKWELLKQPKGANGRFADAHQPDTTFSASKAGDYEFKLTLSNAAGSDSAVAKGAFFVRDRAPSNAKLYERNDHEHLRSFGFEAPNAKRAAALVGKSMPLIAHWTFDEGKGPSVSGRGPRGERLTLGSDVRFAEGRHGRALDLRHIKKPSLDLGVFPELIDDVSVSFWVYHDVAPKNGDLVAAKSDQLSYWNVKFRKGDGIRSNLIYKWYQGATNVQLAKHWVHCIVSFNAEGGVRKMYIDGIQHVWEREAVNAKASGRPRLVFGSPCLIDDVAIYNKTLNHEEAWALFKAKGDAATVTKRVAQDPYQQFAFRHGIVERYFPEEEVETQLEGFAADRFDGSKTPAYSHPRVIFAMEDLPRLRQAARLQREGVANFATVRLFTTTLFGDELSRLKPIATLEDVSKKKKKKGVPAPGSHIKVDHGTNSGGQILAAYRVLMTADSKAARTLIDSMMAGAKLQREKIDATLEISDSWQMFYQDSLGRRTTPLVYDYLYNWMTTEERNFIRRLIADATAQKYSLGMYGVPANHTSNWEPWLTGDLNMALEAISGEEGYDPASHAAAKRAHTLSVLHMNDSESGAHGEPMGKSNLGATQSAVVSRSLPLEHKIVASKAYYNLFAKFMFYNGFPWANDGLYEFGHHGGFLNGGLDRSLRVIHYAYPDDPMLNYLKHSYDGGDTGTNRINPRTFGQESWAVALTMPQDWSGPADIAAHRQQVVEKLDLPLGYFTDFRGQMTSYSDWSREALQLFYVPRNRSVGHAQPIRGMFAINALGRQWVVGRTYDHGDGYGSAPAKNSVITVDGQAGDTSAAKLLFYRGAAEKKGTTFDLLGADLTACYRQIDNNWPSLNHTKLQKNTKRPWMDLPVAALPSPLSTYRTRRPMNFEGLPDIDTDQLKGKVPFERAHRTAVLARGKHPYVLIIDDISKDSEQRSYVWNAPLAEDIMAAKSWSFDGNIAIISDPKDENKQLVIVMQGSEGRWGITPVHSSKKGVLEDMLNLTYTSICDRAQFKALIYPRRKGEPLPDFSGSAGRYLITIGDQVDELHTAKNISISRK
jgi:hypothetical protein